MTTGIQRLSKVGHFLLGIAIFTQLPNAGAAVGGDNEIKAQGWTESQYTPDTLSSPGAVVPLEALSQSNLTAPTPFRDAVSLSYYGIFYGPSVARPGSSQPDSETGKVNPEIPLLVRNYLTLSYDLADDYVMGGTLTWNWRPVYSQDLTLRDPYFKFGNGDLLKIPNLTWYADARVHFPTSTRSRMNDLLVALQTFHIVNYQLGSSPWALGTYASARYNHFGAAGVGNDVEFYLGPNIQLQVSSAVSLNLLYELGSAHPWGDEPYLLVDQGTDLQAGVSWNLSQKINLNPYLNFLTGRPFSWESTSLGMTLSWRLL